MKSFVYELSKKQLKDLYNELCSSGENSTLFESVEERLDYIKKVDYDFVTYSSDRTVDHSEEDRQKWISFTKEFTVSEFPFLAGSTYRCSNRIGVFMCDGELFYPGFMTLAQLGSFYSDEKSIYDYEGTYNTLNYIRDRFYSVGSASLFEDMDEKRRICELKLGDISRYLLEIKNGTKLKLSIGDTGLVRSAHGTYNRLHPYQKNMIDAVAFGSDLDKLKDDNFEDSKRLLYLPRSVKRK